MDESLRAVVLAQLDATHAAGAEWAVLVLDALEGPVAVEARLEGATPPAAGPAAALAPEKPATAHLAAITVEGFRGIGPEARLELTPGPGLTLVVGRNGSGKSSFAEALEVLLTGETFRWQRRSQVWREAWRNLHHPVARVEARFALEGERGGGVVRRRWDPGADLADGVVEVQVQGRPRTTLDALGWAGALGPHRPLLSYDELGALLDGSPSELFDAMASMLGLDDLVAAQKTLQQARTARERQRRDAEEAHGRLLVRLRALDDERARAAVHALTARPWRLDAVERVVAGTAAPAGSGDLDTLRRLAALELPDLARADAIARELRAAAEAVRVVAATAAARARAAAELLERALAFHRAHGDGDCPVCGAPGALAPEWAAARRAEVLHLRAAAETADAAHRRVATARAAVPGLVAAPRAGLLDAGAALGFDADSVRATLAAWDAGRGGEDPDALAAHVETTLPPLRAAFAALASAAAAALDRREDAWRPVGAELAAWLPHGRAALCAAAAGPLLRAAETWLRDTSAAIRRERFAPIAERARALWGLLRRDSHVSLEEIALAGQGTHRRVDLDVTVDGVGSAALGVMSQGELRALALSLFLPRASLPESPFRFVVIDDPVQSMDPARVDGLARALEVVARDRQVVVFTHDDRLTEALRTLAIDATVIEVARREGSVVELRPALDPVARHLEDAFAIARTTELSADVAARVLPGFCRLALEAACAAAVRRRRIGRGEPPGDVARLLEDAGRLTPLAALALFDDRERHADVLPRLDREFGAATATAFRLCNRGAHGAPIGDPLPFVRTVERLARALAARS